jgi:tRNA (guanine-N7-)-methyltransferase
VRAAFEAHGGFVVTEGDRPSWRPTDGFEDKGLRAGRQVSEFRAELR